METKKRYSEESIISAVAEVFCISPIKIFEKTRKKEVVEARQVVAYYFRFANKTSFPTIAKVLGDMDHTTAIYSFQKVISKMEKDKNFFTLVQSVFNLIDNKNNQKSVDGLISESNKITTKNDQLEKKPTLTEKKTNRFIVKNLEITGRERGIMDMYRKGSTLREVSYVFGITRERVRQIVFKVNLKEIGTKTKDGFEIDAEEYIRGDKMTHERAKKAFSPIKIQKPDMEIKEYRWSKFYIKCRSCGTIKTPHIKRGYCEKCLGIRSSKTKKSILRENSVCLSCGMDRGSAIRKFNRDLYITKEGKTLCRGCFLQFTGTKLGQRNRGRSN